MERPEKNEVDTFLHGMERIPAALKKMGYEKLRPGQEGAISNILLEKDTICILPTGGGKSLLFALPTAALEWKTIVFSPLIALMKDQVQSMNAKGIKAACINSAQPDIENYTALKDWQDGELQMLYVAPERISHPQFEMAINCVKPDLVAVDESHCLSQWSATFRPAYCAVGDFIAKYNPRVVAAFTATATDQVVDDIKRILHISNCVISRYFPARTNLELSAEYIPEAERNSRILELVRSVSGSCIVYCQTVREVTEVTAYLAASGESVTFYHGQIQRAEDKSMNQDEFMSGRARICVATNAFGMGIDKPDIEAIVHTGPPGSIEAIAQETGRAARDGRKAICHMLVTPQGLYIQNMFFENSNPASNIVYSAYKLLEANADETGVARMTGADMAEILGDKSAEAACNSLESSGCVERFKEEGQIYTIYVVNDEVELSKANKTLLEAILSYGTPSGYSDENEPVYKIDLNFLAGKCSVLPNTMRTKLMALGKTLAARVKPPFRGKCTRLLRPPTNADLEAIQTRRELEAQKLADVKAYIEADDKHEFLKKYFELRHNGVS